MNMGETYSLLGWVLLVVCRWSHRSHSHVDFLPN